MKIVEIKSAEWNLDPTTFSYYPVCSTNEAPIALRGATYSQLKKLSKNKNIKVEGVAYNTNNNRFDLPKHCKYCGGKLNTGGGMLTCPIWKCSGKPFMAIYNLLSICRVEDVKLEVFKEYLTIFPIGKGNFTNVLNVVDKRHGILTFLTLFRQIGPKDTAVRHELLNTTFGEAIGTALWEMECELANKLRNGLGASEFWWMLDIRDVTDIVAATQLKDLNPTSFLKACEEDPDSARRVLDKMEVTVHTRMMLIAEKDYWTQVLVSLNKFKALPQ